MRHYLLAVLLLVVPVTAAAQSGAPLPQLDAQARVRVWADTSANGLKARVHAVTPESLEVTAGSAGTRVFHAGSLERIDVSRGRNRWVWTAGGMLAGATAGVIISRADRDEGDMIGGLDETAEGMANTISGALIGGIVGFFVAPERWRTVWSR